jgi:hypothetical protein
MEIRLTTPDGLTRNVKLNHYGQLRGWLDANNIQNDQVKVAVRKGDSEIYNRQRNEYNNQAAQNAAFPSMAGVQLGWISPAKGQAQAEREASALPAPFTLPEKTNDAWNPDAQVSAIRGLSAETPDNIAGYSQTLQERDDAEEEASRKATMEPINAFKARYQREVVEPYRQLLAKDNAARSAALEQARASGQLESILEKNNGFLPDNLNARSTRLLNGKRLPDIEQYARAANGVTDVTMGDVWLPGGKTEEDLEGRGVVANVGAALDYLGRAVTSRARNTFGLDDNGQTSAARAAEFNASAQLARRKKELQDKREAAQSDVANAPLTVDEEEELQDLEEGILSSFWQGIKSLPDLATALIDDPEIRRQFLDDLMSQMPGSIATTGGLSMLPKVNKLVKAVNRSRQIKKHADKLRKAGKSAEAEQFVARAQRSAVSQESIKELRDLMTKNPLAARALALDLGADALGEAAYETLTGVGRGQEFDASTLAENLGQGVFTDALPQFALGTARKAVNAGNAENIVTPQEFDRVFGPEGNMDVGPRVVDAETGLPRVPRRGELSAEKGGDANQVRAFAQRNDRGAIVREAARRASDPSTQGMRISVPGIQEDITQAGNGVRGFYNPGERGGTSYVTNRGGEDTILHESVHHLIATDPDVRALAERLYGRKLDIDGEESFVEHYTDKLARTNPANLKEAILSDMENQDIDFDTRWAKNPDNKEKIRRMNALVEKPEWTSEDMDYYMETLKEIPKSERDKLNPPFQFIGERGAAALDAIERQNAGEQRQQLDLFEREVGVRKQDLETAKKMREQGMDAQKIKLATGWETGADGKWRYEIPDIQTNEEFTRLAEESVRTGRKLRQDLRNLVTPESAEQLFGAYRDIADIDLTPVVFDPTLPKFTGGAFNPNTGEIMLNPNGTDLRNSAVHEIQHLLQSQEEFAQGTNLNETNLSEADRAKIQKIDAKIKEIQNSNNGARYEEMQKNFAKIKRLQKKRAEIEGEPFDAFDNYRRNAGETEARNVSRRADYTPEQRRNTTAESTEDVPRDRQIVRFGDGTSASIKSVTDNRGTFDESNPDIRYSLERGPSDDISDLGKRKKTARSLISGILRENGIFKNVESVLADWENRDVLRTRAASKKTKTLADQQAERARTPEIEKKWRGMEDQIMQVMDENQDVFEFYADKESGGNKAQTWNDYHDALVNLFDRKPENEPRALPFSPAESAKSGKFPDGFGEKAKQVMANKIPTLGRVIGKGNSKRGNTYEFDVGGVPVRASQDRSTGDWRLWDEESREYTEIPKDGKIYVDRDETKKSLPASHQSRNEWRPGLNLENQRPPEEKVKEQKTLLPKGNEPPTPNAFDVDLARTETPETRFEAMARVLQDSLRDLKGLQERLKDKTNDAYQAYDLMHGRSDYAAKKMREKFVEPILKIIKNRGLTLSDVDNYLYALHAPAVNAYLKSKNPDMEAGSGMTDARAAEIIENAQKDAFKLKGLQDIAEMNRRMNKWRTDLMVSSGLWDSQKAEKLSKLYPDYVPLRGLPDLTDEEATNDFSTGRGISARADNKQRKGRKSMAENVLSQNFTASVSAVINAERNKAAQALLRTANANKDDAFWVVTDKPRDVDLQKGAAVPVFVDGEKKYVSFKTRRGRNLARNITGLTGENANSLLRGLAKANRFLGSLMTSYSPEFVMTNFIRDYQHAMISAYAKDGPKVAKSVLFNAPRAVAGLTANEMGRKNEWADWAERFEREGGKTGFVIQMKFRDLAKELEGKLADLERKNFDPRKLGNTIMRGIEAANGAVENGTRLAYFRALVESGTPEAKAAAKAKDLTVNFNRKGEWKWMSSVWLFFNASIQGIQNVASLFTSKDPNIRKRAYQGAAAIASAGAAMAVLGNEIAGEDDNGRSVYENIPDWQMAMNMVLPLGKDGGVMLPMPHGFSAIYNTGRMMMDPVLFGERVNALDLAAGMASNLVSAVNPFGAAFNTDNLAKSTMDFIVPAAAKPIMEIYGNTNFAGKPIYPTKRNATTPDSENYFKGTNPAFVEMAKFLNKASGGDKFESGRIDLNPETIEHLWNGYLGGPGRLVQQVGGIAEQLGKEGILEGIKNLEPRQIPFARRLRFAPYSGADRRNLTDAINKTGIAYSRVKELLDNKETREEGKKMREREYVALRFYDAAKDLKGDEKDWGERMKRRGATEEENKKIFDRMASYATRVLDELLPLDERLKSGALNDEERKETKVRVNKIIKSLRDELKSESEAVLEE